MAGLWRRVHVLIWVNVVVISVAFLPGFLGRDYPESVVPFITMTAGLWVLASTLYICTHLTRTGLAKVRQRHARENAELAERHRKSSLQ